MRTRITAILLAFILTAAGTAGAQTFEGENGSMLTALLTGKCRGESIPPAGTDPSENKDSAIVPGVIGFGDEDIAAALQVPDTVRAGEEFEIIVTTSGNGCYSAGETSVILGEKDADVFVYDRTIDVRPGTICTMILKQMPHKARLKFEQKGEAVIRIWGRKKGGDSPSGEPLVIEKRVRVR